METSIVALVLALLGLAVAVVAIALATRVPKRFVDDAVSDLTRIVKGLQSEWADERERIVNATRRNASAARRYEAVLQRLEDDAAAPEEPDVPVVDVPGSNGRIVSPMPRPVGQADVFWPGGRAG